MNVIEFLEEEVGVKVYSKGKNISTGWIGIQCPFPNCDDSSNHFGIRLSDLRCACWKCGGHSFISLVQELTDCNRKEAYRLYKSMVGESAETTDRINPPISSNYMVKSSTVLPPESTSVFPKIHKDYLLRRKFHPNRMIRKYDLKAVHATGKYKFRIVIPIYQNRRLVSFTTRSIFDEMTPKYLHPKRSEVGLSPKEVIYNIDNLYEGHDVLILEGPTDVWRWGNGAVCTNGINYTTSQLSLLVSKKIRNAYIMFDNEMKAQIRAEEIVRILYPFCKSIEQISPEFHNDLAEFTHSQVQEVRKMLKFK